MLQTAFTTVKEFWWPSSKKNKRNSSNDDVFVVRADVHPEPSTSSGGGAISQWRSKAKRRY